MPTHNIIFVMFSSQPPPPPQQFYLLKSLESRDHQSVYIDWHLSACLASRFAFVSIGNSPSKWIRFRDYRKFPVQLKMEKITELSLWSMYANGLSFWWLDIGLLELVSYLISSCRSCYSLMVNWLRWLTFYYFNGGCYISLLEPDRCHFLVFMSLVVYIVMPSTDFYGVGRPQLLRRWPSTIFTALAVHSFFVYRFLSNECHSFFPKIDNRRISNFIQT